MIVIAPRFSYYDGLPIIGWREHDRSKPYPIIRLPLLRTTMDRPALKGVEKLSFRLWDFGLRVRLACVLFWLIASRGVRAVCVGELLASSWIIRLLRFIPGIRTLVYVHGEEITTDDPYDHAHRRGREILLECDAIIVVSRFTQEAVAALLGDTGVGRITLIENGVDTSRFQQKEKSCDLINLYGLRGCFVFISVCRLLEKKGIDQAISAFARVAARHPECRYLIVGTGPFETKLRFLAQQWGLAGKVVFAGQVADDDLVEHYQLGDVFIMPNRELPNGDTEGFGLVFLEANSCGLPVIAGRDGGSTDAVRHGVNGLVVDGRSVDAIAAAMLQLHDNRTSARRSASGRSKSPPKPAGRRRPASSWAFASPRLARRLKFTVCDSVDTLPPGGLELLRPEPLTGPSWFRTVGANALPPGAAPCYAALVEDGALPGGHAAAKSGRRAQRPNDAVHLCPLARAGGQRRASLG